MNKEEAITELLKAARGYERDLLVPRDLKKIFSRALDAYALQVVRECVPAAKPNTPKPSDDIPDLSANLTIRQIKDYGFNSAREQTLKNAEALLTPPTEDTRFALQRHIEDRYDGWHNCPEECPRSSLHKPTPPTEK